MKTSVATQSDLRDFLSQGAVNKYNLEVQLPGREGPTHFLGGIFSGDERTNENKLLVQRPRHKKIPGDLKQKSAQLPEEGSAGLTKRWKGSIHVFFFVPPKPICWRRACEIRNLITLNRDS